jgi:serine/threonine protein kinase/TolA-binding protein/Flp pilus assembly protein TadD
MSSPAWDRLQDLFSRATDLPPEQREAFVTSEAGDDIALRQEVLELLACDPGTGTGPLTNALGAAIDQTTRDRRRAALGQVVSNYKLVSVLGHGGTGTVYLAERADRQYSAQVAVKIIDAPSLHGELGQRFRAERQILASLNHPNIARLIDAGETALGQPYLIMEYVHGEPLDRYCDRNALDLRARLNLFLDICSAVQYAHQNLIVHRDLKPANILVAADGTPKLLDFGIAKLLDAGDAASSLALTRMNDRLLTPEYASPEQILGRPVTTASDVYTLGVVLYELLTGVRPYAVPSSASQLELERTICISDPNRPSTAVRKAALGPAESVAQITTVATCRGLSVEKLERRLQGDLDAIVMRALRKEPQHRYGSAEQFADDIRRYLAREPVLARQGNWAYYSSRFIRRHAFGVSAGIAFAIFLAAFGIVMSIQTQRIAAERDRAEIEGERAERVSEFMLNVFGASDPFVSQGKEFSAKDLLDQAARSIRSDLNQHPEVRARLMEAIGRAYRRQNEFQLAISLLREASRIRESLPDQDGTKQTSVLAELAFAHYQSGDFEEADRTLRRAISIAERSSSVRTPAYAKLLGDLGRVKHQTGDVATARVYLERSLNLSRELLSPFDIAIADILLTLSSIHMWEANLDAAEKSVREALAIYTQSMPEQYPDRVLAQTLLADVLLAKNDPAGAEVLLERSLAAQRILYGEASSQVAGTYDSLAQVRRAQGRWAEAEEYARRAVDSQTQALGNDHFMTGYFHSALSSLLLKQGRHAEAEAELRASLDIYSRTLPPDHQYVAASEYLLGEIMLSTNRLEDAEALLSASMYRWQRTSPSSSRVARSASALGEVLYRMGRVAEAEKYLVEGYTGLARDETAAADERAKARERVTRFYVDRGQRDKLEALMLATNDSGTTPQARSLP